MKHTSSRAHRNHYIPLFVLRTFADRSDRIWWTYTDGRSGPPRLMKCENVFCENDLYTVRGESGISDRNEQVLAKQEDRWACALRRIRTLLSQGLEDQTEEQDRLDALEYYLFAGIRTPEHLRWAMYSGEHKPRDVIDRVFSGRRAEADYTVLENNMRATFGSGQADAIRRGIEELIQTLGLGIYTVKPGAGSFIVGSYGAIQIRTGIWKRSFVPVAPDMALFSTIRPDRLEVESLGGRERDETIQMMNTRTWNSSRQVAATSAELLKAVKKQVGGTNP